MVEVTIEASSAAERYESAYSKARAAQVEQIAYAAIADGGKAIAHAIALGGGEIVQAELERLSKAFEHEASQFTVEQLGNMDTGTLDSSDRMNPIEVSLIQRVLGDQIPAHSLDSVIDKSGRTTRLKRALGTIRDRMSKSPDA